LFKKLIAAVLAAFIVVPALAQQGIQFSPGQTFGNDTASARLGRAAAINAILDRASIVNGAAAGTANTYFNGAGKWDVNLDTLGFVRSSSYYEENATTDHGFTLQARTTAALGYAVPRFRSSKANSPTALDIWPSGPTPVESSGNGFTWVDSCDADLQVNDLTPIRCARIGMTSQGATIGMVNFNGGLQTPILFNVGSGMGTAIKASIDTNGLFKVGLGTDTPVYGSHFQVAPISANPSMSIRDMVNHSEFFAAASTVVVLGSSTNHAVNFRTFNVDRAVLGAGGGFTIGAPTGGNKGDGTINMTGCFVNNVACLTQLSTASGALGADVALNNTGLYFDGPSMAQGTSGTWFVVGKVALVDTGAAAAMACKLWDGTTIIDSGRAYTSAATFVSTLTLAGIIANPVANLRVSCGDPSAVTGKILFNSSANSLDSTIRGIRIN